MTIRRNPMRRSYRTYWMAGCVGMTIVFLLRFALLGQRTTASFDDEIKAHLDSMFEEGKRTFRFDTFGDEAFWGDALKLHRAIVGQKLGGTGPGLSPKKALELRPQGRCRSTSGGPC